MRVLQNHDLHYAGHYGHVVLGARFKSQGFLHRTYRYQVHGVQTYHGMKQMQRRGRSNMGKTFGSFFTNNQKPWVMMPFRKRFCFNITLSECLSEW